MSYWEHELGRSENATFSFKQIHLQTFVGKTIKSKSTSNIKENLKNWIDLGHSNAVRSMCVLDDESTFLSGGRDQKLLIWKIENQNDNGMKWVSLIDGIDFDDEFHLITFRVESRWSYSGYRKTVFAVNFLESLRLAATCDGSVHVSWSWWIWFD